MLVLLLCCCSRMGDDGKCSTRAPHRTPRRYKASDHAVPEYHTCICLQAVGVGNPGGHRAQAARHAQANSSSTPAAESAAWTCAGITLTLLLPTPAFNSMHGHVGTVATTKAGARLAAAHFALIATQLRRPTPRRPLRVANCLKCAAQQLQQLIKLPQSDSHNSSSGTRGQQVRMRHEPRMLPAIPAQAS